MSERSLRRAAQGWTTAARLRKLVFVCWAMLLVVACTAVGSLEVQSGNIRRLTVIDGPAVDANDEVRQAMADAQIGLTGYQLSGDRGLLQPYFGARDRTMAALAALQRSLAMGAVEGADSVQHMALADRQRLAVDQWWANASATEQALTAGRRADLFQSRALFARYVATSSALDGYLESERTQTRLAAGTISTRMEVVTIAATLAALLAMLVLGGLVAGTISRPLVALRDTMVRQRKGDPGARAREDQGSLELRSVAADFNALTDQNLALLATQRRDMGTHQVTLDIGRAIRATSDTQQALEVMCVALGEGLGADRVMANTMGANHQVQLSAQWHLPNLEPLRHLEESLDVGRVAQELWQTTGFRADDDLLALLAADPPPPDELGPFLEATGGRAGIIVPIVLDDQVIGVIHVLMVGGPRAWTIPEANVVQAVAGFVGKAITEAEHQAYQRDYVERVERLDRQKSDFLASVSHELRTPLTSISGYLELLQEQDAGELTAQQHRMLDVISRNTVRLRSLIEDVMVLSRIEGGVIEANFVEVSIRKLIIRVSDELSLLAQVSSIELEIDPGPQTAIVLGDQASLDRAVVNLLSNAIKFSHHGGVVTLRGTLDRAAGRVLVTCQDRGFGIPAQDQADLFTRFFRASNATDRAIPGTGLGLSITKQIVEEHHGGRLRLTSVENEGTTVVMDLPLYERPLTNNPADADSVDPVAIIPETIGNDSDADGVFGIRA